ncbi:MAG: tetratricopeptide repeat protein, partial [Gemmatimonadales bacterium]
EADLLLALGQVAAARQMYAHVLTLEPHRARSVFGAARAAELAGDRAAAVASYRDYLKMLEQSDGDRAELMAARAFVGQGSR